MLSIFGVTKNTYTYAKDYLNIILIGMPFYVVTNALNSIIRADKLGIENTVDVIEDMIMKMDK